METSQRPSTLVPDSVKAAFNKVYAQVGGRRILGDLFTPEAKGRGPFPAVVVVHGGGWLNGYKDKFQALAIALADRGFVTFAIEYRLGHEAKFPAGIHDCNAAVRYLRANAKAFNLDPNRIGAVGGSAGGHLVGLMATGSDVPALQGSGGNPEQSARLQAAVVMAGPLEIISGQVAERARATPGKSNMYHWTGKNIDEDLELYALADAFEKISADDPPMLFMAGEHDRPERNQKSRDALKAHGIFTDIKVYKDGKHGCWNQLPWFNDMVEDMDVFLKKQLGR
jgi:acetyl esterase/lipase